MCSWFKLGFGLLLCSVMQLSAFSLLGPYADWMDVEKSYRLPGDIGGPMGLHEEYRWNIPNVYYGFDQSFLSAFGEDGVQAVEEAIAILNALPASGGIRLTEYPFEAKRVNYRGLSVGLMDMKSVALQSLVEQVGLASPRRFVLALRDIQYNPTNFTMVQRNFDPFDFYATEYINDALYTIDAFLKRTNGNITSYLPSVITVDPVARDFTAIADKHLQAGEYYTGLTRDDVGGFRYLLNSMNWNVEPLLPDISYIPIPFFGKTNLVGTALRPGIEKITFRRLHSSTNEGSFLPATNSWTDNFYINSEVEWQWLERVVEVPDILFSAEDMGIHRTITPARTNGLTVYPEYSTYRTSEIKRTDTSRWINCSSLNNNPGGPGSGVIVPGVKITFPDNRRYLSVGSGVNSISEDGTIFFHTTAFARFDASTNEPVILSQLATNIHEVTLDITASAEDGIEWTFLGSSPGIIYNIDSSTNLTDWVTEQVFTNFSPIVRFTDTNFAQGKFYRTVRTGSME